MYGNLLTKVVQVINNTVGRPRTPSEDFDAFAEAMFNQKAYASRLERERKREELKWRLIGGATIIAAAGELYHVVKRSDLMNRLKR